MVPCALIALAATLETSGSDRLGQLLPKLGQSVGEQWRASPAVADEVAAVHAPGAGAGQLRAKLAAALRAEWERDGEVFVLVRPRPLADDKAGAAREAARSVVAQCRKALERSLEPGALADALQKVREGGPESRGQLDYVLASDSAQCRLLYRLLLAVGEESLAQALERKRSVFAVRPNRSQSPLHVPPEALAAYVREEEAWDVAIEAAGVPPGETVSSPGGGQVAADRPERLRIEVTWRDPRVWVNLRERDTTPGRTPVLAQRTFMLDSDAEESLRFPGDGGVLLPVEPGALAYAHAVEPHFAEYDDEALARLLDPVRHEPLAQFAGPLAIEWAKARGKPLAAHIPEAAFGVVGFVREEGVPLKQYEGLCAMALGWSAEPDKDGWLVPASPARLLRWADRAEVRGLIEAVLAAKSVRLEQAAQLAHWQAEYSTYWPRAAAMAAAPLSPRERHTGLYEGLRLVHALGPALMARLRKGESVSAAELTAGQRAVMEEVAFGSVCHNSIIEEQFWTHSSGGPEADPSDVCPDGLPLTATVTLRTRLFPRVATLGGGDDRLRLLRLDDRWSAARTYLEGGSKLQPNKSLGVVPVFQSVVILRLTLAPGAWHEWDLNDGLQWQDTAPMPYKDVPARFRPPPGEDG